MTCNCHSALLDRMFVLPMTTFRFDVNPTIVLDEPDNVSNFHAASALLQNLRRQALFGFGVQRAFQGVLP